MNNAPATDSAPITVCHCCCGSFDEAAWKALPLVGYSPDYEGGWLELRNTPCGSTRAILLLEEPADAEEWGVQWDHGNGPARDEPGPFALSSDHDASARVAS